MERNKTALHVILIFATVSLLAGLQIASASPKPQAKTSKHSQEVVNKATTTRAEVVFSNATLTADQIHYAYDNGKLVPIQAWGHVELEAKGTDLQYSLVATSQTAVFNPIDMTRPGMAKSFLIDMQDNKKSAGPFDGTVTLKGSVEYQYDVDCHDSGWHRDCLAISWLTYDPGKPTGPALIMTPAGRDDEILIEPLIPDTRKKIDLIPVPLRRP